MPRIKLIAPGWEGFSGDFGGALFEDGVSEEITPFMALRLSSIVTARDAVAGTDYSAGQTVLDGQDTPASNDDGLIKPEDLTLIDHSGAQEDNGQGDVYTVADLEAIASSGGIKALRVIAEPYKVQGKKITDLITELVRAGARMPGKVDPQTRVAGNDETLAAQVNAAYAASQNDGAQA